MSWLWDDRLAEVWAWPGRSGAGVLFGASGVLTARHNIAGALGEDQPGRVQARLVRRGEPPSPWTGMRVLAEDPDWDLAVLAVDPSEPGRAGWMAPTMSSPVVTSVGTAAVPGCEAVGFPDEAVQRVDPERPDQNVRQTDQVFGTLLPMGQAKQPLAASHPLPQQWMPLDVDTAAPTGQAGWGGMSGAGVLLPDGRLIGLVVAAEAAHQQRRLYVVPLASALTKSPRLRDALTTVTGAPIAIAPPDADRGGLDDSAVRAPWARERVAEASVAADPLLLGMADRVARIVGDQWRAETQQRGLVDRALPVEWGPADPDLFDDWQSLEDLATGGGVGWPPPGSTGPPWRQTGWAASAAELSGSRNELIRTLAQVPTGRLVVLGEPGAGKTVLLIRLVTDLLARRVPGGPVPILVPLASWNPTAQGLYQWLESRLKLDYPVLAPPALGGERRSFARALLDSGLILPVLDGLDEIQDSVRGPAISKINDVARPGQRLVLASRSQQYREAVRPERDVEVRLAGAAGVELRPLEVNAVRRYLVDSAGGPRGVARWEPVLAALSRDPAPPVALALTTPLMVTLARTIYNPRPGERSGTLPNPRELLWLSTRRQVEHHLFDGFLPAAYRPYPDRDRRERWRPDDAQRWLVFLARHLEQNLGGTPDLAWWELPAALGARRRWLPRALVGVAAWAALSLLAPLPIVLAWIVTFGVKEVLAGTPSIATMFAILEAVFAAAAAYVWSIREPAGAVRWHPIPDGLPLGPWLVSGIGLIAGLSVGLEAGLLAALVTGSVAALTLAVPAGFRVVPVDLTAAASPPASISLDRRAFWSFPAAYVLSVAVVVSLDVSIRGGWPRAVSAGLVFVFAFAPGFGLVAGLYQTAWASFAVARGWLAVRRRLPRRLMAFLADAHRRGVLRQAGAVYRFRHLELQRRLATAGGQDEVGPVPPASTNTAFDKFTDGARLSVFAAREASRALRQRQVGTGHLLLGLAIDRAGRAARVLAATGVTAAEMRREILASGGEDEDADAVRGEFRFTPAAKNAVQAAARDAQRGGDGAVDSDHLLLALIQDSDCTAGRLLRRLGADLDRIRDEAVRLRDSVGGTDRALAGGGIQDRAVLSLVGLGDLLASHADVVASRIAYRQAIDSGHPDQTPMAMVNLGLLLEARGYLAGARSAYERAIDSGHTDQAWMGMVNLGALLESHGHLQDASMAYWRAAHTGHPDAVAVATAGMGSVLAAEGALARAQAAYREAVSGDHLSAVVEEIARRLGADHPHALNARFILARLTGEAGDAEQARELFSALVEDGMRLFGPDDLGTRASRANLAYLDGRAEDSPPAWHPGAALVAYLTQARSSGEWATFGAHLWVDRSAGGARDPELDRDLCAERVEYWTGRYGADHEETLLARADLVELTLLAGDPQRARKLGVDLAGGLIRVLRRARRGDEFARSRLADALARVSAVLDTVGRPAEALAAAEETVRIHRMLAEKEPDAFLPTLAASLDNLYGILSSLERRNEALVAAAEAVEICRRLAASDPATFTQDLAGALTSHGRALAELGRWDEALADLEQAIGTNPDDAFAIGSRAEVYRTMGRYADALVDFNQAVELDPKDPWAIGSRGQTYRAMRRYDDALNDLSRAIDLDPTLAWVFAERGETRRLMGRFEEAVADFDAALTLDAQNAWFYGHRARAYRDMGLTQQAEEDFRLARALDATRDWADPDASRTIGEVT